jgi:hypothetical protein
MSNLPEEDRATRKVVEEFSRLLRQKSKEEREVLLGLARDEALAEELAEAREQSEREAAALREELAYDPGKERDRARETAKSAALLLIMLLLILLLIAAATGRTDILPLPGVQATQTLRPYLTTTPGNIGLNSRPNIPTFPPGVTPEVDQFFIDKYNAIKDRGIECSIGNPITPGYIQLGLHYQWFERAVLKEMPAGSTDDPEWAIQGEPLGRQVTTAIPLETAQPFLSQPGTYYFGETGHSVNGSFLDFWLKCDGLHLLGYPVSEQVTEVVAPGRQLYQVQYFERGRLEYHQDDPNQRVQFGLLGLIKARDKDFKPTIEKPPYPGAPPPATPIPAPNLAATATPPPAATALPASTATAVPAAPTARSYPAP